VTVWIVSWPGCDLEAFSTAARAAQHVRDGCSQWAEDSIDFRGLDKVASGDSMICSVETPDGDVGIEQCEVREEVAA
jgi:hypothetical protein